MFMCTFRDLREKLFTRKWEKRNNVCVNSTLPRDGHQEGQHDWSPGGRWFLQVLRCQLGTKGESSPGPVSKVRGQVKESCS